jgi:Holliday junction resolvase RusA-like endonuclease
VIEPVTFRAPALRSKKNRRITFIRNGKVIQMPDPKILKEQRDMRDQLSLEYRGKVAHFADNEVAVHVKYYPRTLETEVCISDMGPRPKKYSGRRRDLQNVLEALLDALQGPILINDNQVSRITVERCL